MEISALASSSEDGNGTDFASSGWAKIEDLCRCIGAADKVLHNIERILDQMRPENIHLLKDQIVNAGITSRDILKGVTWLIFEKAAGAKTFYPMYAELCSILSRELPSFPSDEPDGKRISFRRMFVGLCQETFEGNHGLLDEMKQMIAPHENSKRRDLERITKLRAMGNIRLIGELFKQEVIIENIVHHCIQGLLLMDKKVEGLEHVCQLLNIVGKKLEQNTRLRVRIDSYFETMKKLSGDQNLPSSVRLMVRDVLHLRANKWIPENEEVKQRTLDMYLNRKMRLRSILKQKEISQDSKQLTQTLKTPNGGA